MKILMTTDSLGGVWNHVLELTRGLQGHGCVIHLVVFGTGLSSAQRLELSECENLSYTQSNLRLEWMDDPWEDQDAAAELIARLAGEIGPDVLHVNGYALAAKARWEVPVVVGAHSCVLSWWNAVKREGIPPWLIRYREEVAAGLAAADAVVAPTRAMLDDLKKIYEVDFGGLVIGNGIDPSPFSNDDNKLPRVLSAGRAWDEAKNIQLLDVIAEDVAWPILVAGDTVPPLAGKTRSFANLQLLGQLSASALRQEMRRAAIYAAPAWYEPFGLAVLEAALSGCALVLADIPSFHELWHDAALLVDLGKPDLWKTTVNALIDNPQMQSVLSKRARQRALALSRTAMSASYYALYRHLAKLQDVEMQSAT